MEATTSGIRQPSKKRAATTIYTLGNDVLATIFSFLNLIEIVRCSAVCKPWSTVIDKLKLKRMQYHNHGESSSLCEASTCSEKSLNARLGQLAMNQHMSSLREGHIDIYQWKAHSVGVSQCRMKKGMVLTGVGDKVMRLWSSESCKCLEEYVLPDKVPLVDFDFDENKVVGLVGTRIRIWRRTGERNVFSSRENLFKGLCMRYVDPVAVIGCEDGKTRVFDMYSRKCSHIIKMHEGPVSCVSLSEDELLVSGSSLGSISISDLSCDQRVVSLKPTDSAGIRSLCFDPSRHLLFSGSTAGYASCWDLRTMRTLWVTRVSPNIIYSMNHMQNERSTLVVGGIDGILRIVDQANGEVISRCIIDESSNSSNLSKARLGLVEKKKARRLSEDTRIDLMHKASRPPITCLAVGMQKVVTTHNSKYIRVWKFRK